MRKVEPAAPAARRPNFSFAPRPERLVLTGYRCWQAGYETGDIACWELAWNEYAGALGARNAKTAMGELANWVRTLRGAACRALSIYPHACRYMTADEMRAVCLVGACQADRCPLARALAYELLASTEVDRVIDASSEFASVLAEAEMIMSWTSGPEAENLKADGVLH